MTIIVYVVEYWASGNWWFLASFGSKEEAQEYVKYEEMRDSWMTSVNGIDHIVEYRIAERVLEREVI